MPHQEAATRIRDAEHCPRDKDVVFVTLCASEYLTRCIAVALLVASELSDSAVAGLRSNTPAALLLLLAFCAFEVLSELKVFFEKTMARSGLVWRWRGVAIDGRPCWRRAPRSRRRSRSR